MAIKIFQTESVMRVESHEGSVEVKGVEMVEETAHLIKILSASNEEQTCVVYVENSEQVSFIMNVPFFLWSEGKK